MKRKFKWLKKGRIFKTNGFFEWSKTHTALPTPVLLDKNVLRIFYSTRDSEQRSRISYIDVNPDNPQRVEYIHDKPIMDLGGIGTFDDRGMTTSFVKQINDEFYFYYNGYNLALPARYRIAIGLATSKKLDKDFNKKSSGPIIDRSIYSPCGSATPFIIEQNGYFKMWFTSFIKWEIINGEPEPFYRIAYAESKDGVDWKIKNERCIDLQDDEGGIVRPTVLRYKEKYHMWFSVRKNTGYRDNSKNSYRIGYAYSSDGIIWHRVDSNVGIAVSNEGWDSFMIAYPFVIPVNNKIYMFYNGNGFGQSGFGYAELEV